MAFDVISLLACILLTVLGLITTVALARRRHTRAATRALAWSLIPLGVYLTGLLPLAGEVGEAALRWALGLTWNPLTWIGLALLGVALVLFVAAGLMRGRTGRGPRPTAGTARQPETPRGRPRPQVEPAREPADRRGRAARSRSESDEDFAEVEEILRRRGI